MGKDVKRERERKKRNYIMILKYAHVFVWAM